MNLETRSMIEKSLHNVGQLPTLPVVYSRLQMVLSNPHVSAQEVGRVIEQDQALASKMLRVVNSAYYGFPRKISTLSQTVVILGFNEVKHLALSISIMNAFGGSEEGDDGFDRMEFWRHGIGVAVCSGFIAKKVGAARCGPHEEAFVAGLLHDVGKIVEDQYMHRKFLEALRERRKRDLTLYDAEKAAMGFTHEETGEYLAETWKLPQTLVAAAGFHHSPLAKKGNASLFTLVSVIHIADIIARSLALGSGGDSFVPYLCEESWRQTGLDIDALEGITVETTHSFDEMSRFLLPATQRKGPRDAVN